MAYLQGNQPGLHAAVTTQPIQPAMIGSARPLTAMNIKATKGLGITQIVLGSIAICFGIAAAAGFDRKYWLNESGGGIWGGAWILTTGIIGVLSGCYPKNGGLNGTHMAFNIIATIVAFTDGILFAAGYSFYNNCYLDAYRRYNYRYTYYDYYEYDEHNCNKHKTAALAVYAILLAIMVCEFFIAMIAAIYCCQATGSCCTSTSSNRGIIVQQGQPHYIVTSSTGQTFMATSYPPNVATTHQPQMVQTTPYTGQAAFTNVAYSTQYDQANVVSAPPSYVR